MGVIAVYTLVVREQFVEREEYARENIHGTGPLDYAKRAHHCSHQISFVTDHINGYRKT